MARRSLTVIIGIPFLALGACGGGGSSGAAPTSSVTAGSTAVVRHGDVHVVHLLQNGQRRLTLQAVRDTGEVVMTAIESDADDAVDAEVPQVAPR